MWVFVLLPFMIFDHFLELLNCHWRADRKFDFLENLFCLIPIFFGDQISRIEGSVSKHVVLRMLPHCRDSLSHKLIRNLKLAEHCPSLIGDIINQLFVEHVMSIDVPFVQVRQQSSSHGQGQIRGMCGGSLLDFVFVQDSLVFRGVGKAKVVIPKVAFWVWVLSAEGSDYLNIKSAPILLYFYWNWR